MRTKIKTILQDDKEEFLNQTITTFGWVKTIRKQKTFAFIELNDGSIIKSIQVVADDKIENYNDKINEVTTGCSIQVEGKVVASPGKNQKYEIHATDFRIIGQADPETYPLQKKRHSFEFLRQIAHLRPRTNTQGAVMRVRHALAFATHKFFNDNGFLYIHTPIITSSDCEGGGDMFRVTTLDQNKPPLKKDGSIDYAKDFFARQTFLTVSGQLNVECFACALGDVYTFGPTFRAENSHTARHLAEFWMIEPELAFCDLEQNIAIAEKYIKFIIGYVLENCSEDLEFFDKFIEKGLLDKLKNVVDSPFEIITYTKAIEILEKANRKWEYPISWGKDMQSEHERYLAEEHFKKPVVVTDYPAAIKAFYMRENEDGKTVAAMDILMPRIGEIIGGSQREERYDVLLQKIKKMGLNEEDYLWYLDLRKYGSVPHSGFGLGFERLVQFVTGMENIRDTIPFPRYPGHAKY